MTNKLPMEKWRKFKMLNEGISDVVYHYTSGIEKGNKILKDNKFLILSTILGEKNLYIRNLILLLRLLACFI